MRNHEQVVGGFKSLKLHFFNFLGFSLAFLEFQLQSYIDNSLHQKALFEHWSGAWLVGVQRMLGYRAMQVEGYGLGWSGLGWASLLSV